MSQLEIKRFKPMEKGYLVGFLDVFIPVVGLQINGITWFHKEGRTWFNMPSEPYTNELGEKKYRPHCFFVEKRYYEGFCQSLSEKASEYVTAMAQQENSSAAKEIPDPSFVNDGVPF